MDADLVRRLVAAQFPQWAGLPVTPVVPGGHDNRTFRLGDTQSTSSTGTGDLLVRLPSGEAYAQQVAKEQRWLPRLAPRLPLAIPQPVAHGAPGEGYPYEWSVYRWLEGEPATAAGIADPVALAVELAGFLRALGAADAAGGPPPGLRHRDRLDPAARAGPGGVPRGARRRRGAVGARSRVGAVEGADHLRRPGLAGHARGGAGRRGERQRRWVGRVRGRPGVERRLVHAMRD